MSDEKEKLQKIVSGAKRRVSDKLGDANATTKRKEQFFDNFASRGIYDHGSMACTLGPLYPWDPAGNSARMKGWNSENHVWELYDLKSDFSQANDLASAQPERLAKMKAQFLVAAKDNDDLPIGGAIWTRVSSRRRSEDKVHELDVWTQHASHARVHRPGVGQEE